MTRMKIGCLAMIAVGLIHWDSRSFAQSTADGNDDSYFIQGAVKKPGVYQIESSASALKLIAMAGGLSGEYGATAFILRRTRPETVASGSEVDLGRGFKLISLDVPRLLKGEFQSDARLEAGDILNIPPTEVFFVAGEVARFSIFPLKEGMTVRQATALALGVNNQAQLDEVVILRTDPSNGSREEIKVNLGEIMRGRIADAPMMANDIIVVPKHAN